MNALEELRRIRAASGSGLAPGAEVGEADAAPVRKAELADKGELKDRKMPASSAADVVRTIVTSAGRPIPHSQILKEMIGRGYTEAASRQAIASCQQQRWIAHNLVSGYVADTF